MNKDIDDPNEEALFYWPAFHRFDGQALTIKVTGYEPDGSHWTGYGEFNPDDEEYGFFVWLAANKEYHRVISRRELPAIKKHWLESS